MEVQVKVISYAPIVFRFIRAIDKISEIEIMKSVKPQLNRMQIFKTNQGSSHNNGGMSGSFFFFTEDKKYIIKTMTYKEKKTLMQMLPSTVKFLIETGGKSMISRIYGVYRVKYPGMASIYLMLQKNNIQIEKQNTLMNTFDLKGSRFKRKVIDVEEYDQIWGSTSHLSQNSKADRSSLQSSLLSDKDLQGTQINRENITDELRLAEEVKKRRSVDSVNPGGAKGAPLSPKPGNANHIKA